ncbi:MAG: copper resistance protein CopC [Thermoleophilia bacterium]
MRMIRVAVTALLLAGAAAPAALGHAGVAGTNPAAGAVVTRLPKVVTITFTEVVARAGACTVTHNGLNFGMRARLNPADHHQLRITTRGGTAAGSYTVRWRVTATDGHRMGGRFGFRVR